MIKANELRIGNIISDAFSNNVIVGQIAHNKIFYLPDNLGLELEYARPIPLTPEILEAAGFEKERDIYKLKAFDSFLHAHPHGGVYYFFLIDKKGHVLSEPEKYLHQLQNLYYSLTGEELKVSLTEKVNV